MTAQAKEKKSEELINLRVSELKELFFKEILKEEFN